MTRHLIMVVLLLSVCALPAAAWELEEVRVESFFDVFLYANTGINPGPAVGNPVNASGFAVIGSSPSGAVGTFDTEMLSMSLTGIAPLGPYTIRESPTRASSGRRQPGAPGAPAIDSFFDVFTELSLDGGQTWIHNTAPAHYAGMSDSFFDITYDLELGAAPIYLYQQDGTLVGELRGSQLRTVTPEPGSLLALAAGFAGLGGVVLRRRR